jgi:hypothetical protein
MEEREGGNVLYCNGQVQIFREKVIFWRSFGRQLKYLSDRHLDFCPKLILQELAH